jgi:hypothetical protein
MIDLNKYEQLSRIKYIKYNDYNDYNKYNEYNEYNKYIRIYELSNIQVSLKVIVYVLFDKLYQ